MNNLIHIYKQIALVSVMNLVDTWLTEFRIDRICVVLQKGYVLYV